jgi:hypothetical protein
MKSFGICIGLLLFVLFSLSNAMEEERGITKIDTQGVAAFIAYRFEQPHNKELIAQLEQLIPDLDSETYRCLSVAAAQRFEDSLGNGEVTQALIKVRGMMLVKSNEHLQRRTVGPLEKIALAVAGIFGMGVVVTVGWCSLSTC